MDTPSRRLFLSASTVVGVVGVGALVGVGACRGGEASDPSGAARLTAARGKPDDGKEGKEGKEKEDEEVGAVEDLMREHGVLRRAIIVYRESATRLRANASSVPPDVLTRTAKLFRSFGEDYHERKLEETYIFPVVKSAGGVAATDADILLAQHQRGRELTDYILSVTQAAKVGANATALAGVLDSFVRMYASHTAIEDTVVFPAWKRTIGHKRLKELGEKFEDIEKATFGKDGFDDGVAQMAAVESALGIADLSKFTAPPPPKVV